MKQIVRDQVSTMFPAIETPHLTHRTVIYVGSYLLAGAVAVRGLGLFIEQAPSRYVAATLFAGFGLLLLLEPRLSRRFAYFSRLYVPVQTLIVLMLLLLPAGVDVFAVLFIPLILQTFLFFSQRTGIAWVGVFMLCLVAGMLYRWELLDALGFILFYATTYVFAGAYVMATQQIERAHEASQRLLQQLRAANRQLEAYAAQAKELAAMKERTRLARDLHDVVTQLLFSMTLTAQSARMLLDREPAGVAPLLERLQALTQDAHAEMRTLIRELRLPAAANGLVPALREHIEERRERDGLKLRFEVSGQARLPTEHREALFRVVQEALNNVVKHAGTRQATVRLTFGKTDVALDVEDSGVGFDSNTIRPTTSQFGLAGMRERVEAVAGTFTVESNIGNGTRIHVRIPRQEREPDDHTTDLPDTHTHRR